MEYARRKLLAMGLNDLAGNREPSDLSPPKRFSLSSGPMHIPSGSHILERLYNDQGVRIRMVRRGRPNKVPTVKELIDHLTQKHERLLELEAKGSKVEKPETGSSSTVSRQDTNMKLENLRDSMEPVNRDTERGLESARTICLSERTARFEVWGPDVRSSLEVMGYQKKPSG
ncbi:hypothetical protein ACF0H5_005454 [Mactra antiquata]